MCPSLWTARPFPSRLSEDEFLESHGHEKNGDEQGEGRELSPILARPGSVFPRIDFSLVRLSLEGKGGLFTVYMCPYT